MYKVIIKNGEIIATPREDFISDSDLIAGLEDVTVNDIQLVKDEPFYNPATGKFQLFNKQEYQKQKAKEERKRLDGLSMTRGDVFEALILAQRKTKAELRKFIEEDERLDDITKELYLNRFDEALEFYRGYPIFDLLAEKLGITTKQLDEFFETKDYRKLIPVKSEEIKGNEAETGAGEAQTGETGESAETDYLLNEDEIPF